MNYPEAINIRVPKPAPVIGAPTNTQVNFNLEVELVEADMENIVKVIPTCGCTLITDQPLSLGWNIVPVTINLKDYSDVTKVLKLQVSKSETIIIDTFRILVNITFFDEEIT